VSVVIRNSSFYAISNVRYQYYEFNATVYPAYIDINYHECMFFVCETLYITAYIQTGNTTTEN